VRVAHRPAAEQLRRMRWVLTLMYAAVSAAALVSLLVIAAFIDARSTSQDLDSLIGGRAQALSRAVWIDRGTLHLEPLSEDELATASDVTAVLQRPVGRGTSARWLRPRRSEVLPPAGRLDDLWETTVHTEEPVLATAAGPDGRELRWATAPVWDTDDIGAVVLVGVDPAPGQHSHATLVWRLAAGCAVLVLASAGAGHLLSGRSMRPGMRAFEQQEQFLAEAAHELRTPLATLRLTIENAGSRSTGDLAASRCPGSGAPDALDLVDRLDRLVTGLLSRAQVDSGTRPLELTPLRLDLLVEQVVQELPHGGPQVRLRTEAGVVLGDPDLLMQAVHNLVENALRHGVPTADEQLDGPSVVDVTVAGGQLSVRDYGAGIADQEKENIFGDRVTSGRGGIGVGLAIVRWVAELHGGRAYVAPVDGPGALVVLDLPEFIVHS
jgi:two-component system, OmpR family, sensor kinase